MKIKKSKHSNSHLHFEKRNNLLKCKRSQGHIEMILSFAIFIGFVVAMLIFLNPVRDQKINYAAVDIAENQIMKNISFEFRYFGLILTQAPSGSCFSVDNPGGQTGNVIVRDMDNRLLNSVNEGGKIYLTTSPISGARFYKLYFSSKFNYRSFPSYLTCPVLPTSNYSFGPLYIDRAVLTDSLKPLTDAYMADYSELRKSLGVAEDFEFVVYDLNKTKIFYDTSMVHKLKTTFVLSRDIPLIALDKNASMSDITLNVRVW
jgi:hypothetical protein